MPKLKTKSSAKKRFKFTATGKVKSTQAMKRHNLSQRSGRTIRGRRGMDIMDPSDAPRISVFMPYGSK